MNAIRTTDLTRSFGPVRALAGLSLSVPTGSVFGFLGRNGAGKTTTMRILAGLARPDGGTATVAGVDAVRDRRGLARKIGYLPEEPAFPEWLSARDLLDHVGRLFGAAAGERGRRTAELLDFSGLTEAADRRIGGYSRGMRQRLGLAQALVNRPEVLLLDEPASALDPAGRREVLDFIDRLRGSCTVFLSTHILADVGRVCDRVGILDRGRLVRAGEPAELAGGGAPVVIRIETEPAAAEALGALLDRVRNEPWAGPIAREGHRARLVPREPDPARAGLVRAIADAGLPLVRFEVATPDLEEIFLELVDGEGA